MRISRIDGETVTKLESKVALITGSASGIGSSTAELFAREGAFVIVSDIDKASGEAFVASLANQNLDAEFHLLDVSDEDDWEAITDHIERRHAKLDILVNNAGFSMGGKLEDTSLEDFRNIVSVDLEGTFLGIKYGIRAMKSSGGVIVNVSSITGRSGFPYTGPVAACKGAVNSMTRVAALECSRSGYDIRVNTISPGAVDTNLWTEQGWSSDSRYTDHEKQAREEILAHIPMKRFADPAEISRGILFLACSDSAYMHGAELVLDGGVISGNTLSSRGSD